MTTQGGCCDDGLLSPRQRGQPGQRPDPLRQLHRRRVGAAEQGRLLREPHRRSPARPFTEIARSTAEDIDLALDAAHGAKRAWGTTSRRRARQHPEQDRRPHRGRTSRCSRSPRAGRTASRSARRWPPTCRSRSTTSATSPARSAPRRAASPRSTTTPWRTTSTSRSASSARSSRGTSRS